MSVKLTWFPEAYPPSGGLAAAGFYKLLGRPRLDPLTVLVRETAQNSWDARDDRFSTVWFGIQGWDLLDTELATLRDHVFPHAKPVNSGLHDTLRRPKITGLFICDRGTHGLGGPLTASEVSPDGIYDWVDFVLNVGKPNTHGHTGGTYGFGKTITYIVSSVNAVVIHSRTMHRGRRQSRLIACAIGDEFKRSRMLYTGRHWWGAEETTAPLPVTGTVADELAAAIGMPHFERDELGTNILVVAPDFAGRTPQQAMRFIAESITWHLWPKLLDHGSRHAPMHVDVSWNEDSVAVPDPRDRPPLQGFARAFSALLDNEKVGRRPDGLERVVIKCQRPQRDVGDLVTVPLVTLPRAEVDDGHEPTKPDGPPPAAAITDACHHVAIMRTPELVVEYVPGPVPADGGTEWAAVFRARPDVDGFFAQAEPPTHDSWRPELLDKGQGKTLVKVGLERIRGFLEGRWGAPKGVPDEPVIGGTAVIADELAHLIRAVPSSGRGRSGTGGGNGGGTPGVNAKLEFTSTGVALIDELPATVAEFTLTPKRGSIGTRLNIAAAVALDDAASDPDLDPVLQLKRLEYDGQTVNLTGRVASVDVMSEQPVEVRVAVTRGPDTAVSFDIRPEPIEDE